MITFKISIQEHADGHVQVSAETPPTKATLREMDYARQLQDAIKNLSGKVIVEKDWQHRHANKAN